MNAITPQAAVAEAVVASAAVAEERPLALHALDELDALPRSSAANSVLATLAVIAALWWGQRFLVPLSAGLMLAMLVMPLNVALTHRVRSRALATVLTLVLVMIGMAAAALAFGGQLLRVAERAPR